MLVVVAFRKAGLVIARGLTALSDLPARITADIALLRRLHLPRRQSNQAMRAYPSAQKLRQLLIARGDSVAILKKKKAAPKERLFILC